MRNFVEIDEDEGVSWDDYESNYLGTKVLQSELTLEQKIKYIDTYACLDDSGEGASLYASVICACYVIKQAITPDTRSDLLVEAIVNNQEPNSWRDKITLINMINSYFINDRC